MKRAYAWGLTILACLGVIFATNVGAKEETVVKTLDIHTIQPRLVTEEFMPPSTLQGVAQSLADKFNDKIKYADEYEYTDIITTRAIQKLGANQIILWRGHGDWDYENEQPVLRTGRDFNEAEAEADTIRVDFFYEAITPEYISKNAGDMSGSLVYLDVCESARNSKLADVFLAKGAETVLGVTDTAEMTYNNNVQDKVITLLGEVNPETGNYYTIGEALNVAKNEYGEKDPGSGGEIVIFGNTDYRVASIIQVVPGAPDTGVVK